MAKEWEFNFVVYRNPDSDKEEKVSDEEANAFVDRLIELCDEVGLTFGGTWGPIGEDL